MSPFGKSSEVQFLSNIMSLVLCSVAFVALLAQSDKDLIEQLRSAQPRERDAAYSELRKRGTRALPLLEAATQDKDLEVSVRAARLIRVITTESQLSPRLRTRFPQLAENVCDAGPTGWTTAFLELVGEANTLQEELRMRDFGHARESMAELATRALNAAEDRAPKVLAAIARRDLHVALPAVKKRLSDPSPEIRAAAVDTLMFLGAKEAGPALLALLGDDAPPVRRGACKALGELRFKEAVPRLEPFLLDPDSDLRANAVEALGKLEAGHVAPKLIPLLRDEDTYVQTCAFMALGSLRAVDQVPSVLPFLQDEETWVRAHAIDTIASILGFSGLSKLLPMMRDSHPNVREVSIHAMVRMTGNLRPSPELLEALRAALLKDEVPKVRAAAAGALSGWQDADSIPGIVALLRTDDEGSRMVAALALARLDASDHTAALLPLLQDKSDTVRAIAAESLCDLGSKEGIPALLQAAEKGERNGLHHLNAIHNRKAWVQLKSTRRGLPPSKKREELLAELAKELGLELELPERVETHDDDWADVGSLLPFAHGFGMPLSGFSHLDWLQDATSGTLGFSFILEDRKLRVVTPKEALAYWKK